MFRSLTLCLALTGSCLSAFAQAAPAAKPDEHAAHHPASAPPATAPAPAAAPGMAKPMDAQLKAMRELREKMMAARSPEERKALKAEQMKLMRQGMAMMGSSPPASGGKMGMMDMQQRQAQMEKRMDMMQSMMQMMMDCMAEQATP